MEFGSSFKYLLHSKCKGLQTIQNWECINWNSAVPTLVRGGFVLMLYLVSVNFPFLLISRVFLLNFLTPVHCSFSSCFKKLLLWQCSKQIRVILLPWYMCIWNSPLKCVSEGQQSNGAGGHRNSFIFKSRDNTSYSCYFQESVLPGKCITPYSSSSPWDGGRKKKRIFREILPRWESQRQH